jgi:hypothetical protein
MRPNREMARKEYEEFLRARDPYSQADVQLTRFDNILTAMKRASLRLKVLPSEKRIYNMLVDYVRSRRIHREWERE